MADPNDPIKHIVLVMLENASCDRYLGCLTDTILPNFDGIRSANPGTNFYNSKTYVQVPTIEKQVQWDPGHEQVDVLAQLANDNGGFVSRYASTWPKATAQELQQIMSYFPMDFLPAHHMLARSFRPCDRWFSSLPGPTWPNRFFALSGTSNGLVKMPSGIKNLRMAYSETQPTIFTRLAEAGKTFKIFYHDFPSSCILLQNLINTSVRNQYVPFTEQFESLTSGPEAKFPEFSFVEARYYGDNQNDDHPPHNVMKGQKLIADVYNAVRQNSELWKSTLIVLLHDEHGGFYDHVVPPMGAPPPAPAKKGDEYGFQQFGVRVPAILISPWVDHGTEKTQFDHTSLLKYLKDKWNLGDLGDRANSPSTNSIKTALNFTRPARDDTPGKIAVTPEQLISPHPSWELSATGHHYACDLFISLLSDDAGTEFLSELANDNSKTKISWRLLAKVSLKFLAMLVVDYIQGMREEDAAKATRNSARETARNILVKKIFINAEKATK